WSAIQSAKRSHQPARVQEEDGEGRRSEPASNDGLVPREPGADVLKIEVVLIRPEPRNLRERLAVAGDRPAHRVPVPESGVVVLHTYGSLEERGPEAGAVPSRVDAGGVRPREPLHPDCPI